MKDDLLKVLEFERQVTAQERRAANAVRRAEKARAALDELKRQVARDHGPEKGSKYVICGKMLFQLTRVWLWIHDHVEID